MKEVDKLKVEKQSYEHLHDKAFVPSDKSMKICETCGALQSITDTDKRMGMHLEGKLHTGYLKVRKVLNELKKAKEEHRKLKEREQREKGRRRSPSRSHSGERKKQENSKVEESFYYSSKRLGTGKGLPSNDITNIRFTDQALTKN